jgi:hypothetical protein
LKKLNFIFLLVFFICSNSLYAANFKLLISYLEGEHSKDSWTRETTITVDEKVYSFSITGSGAHKSQDENKNGAFTTEQYNKIKSFIFDNNMLVNDSLTDDNSKYKAFERFTNIVIKIYIDTNAFSIRLNGDIENLQEQLIYKNAMGLINLATDFIKNEK